MDKVLRTFPVIGMNLIEAIRQLCRVGGHVRADGREFIKNAPKVCILQPRTAFNIFERQKPNLLLPKKSVRKLTALSL
jgi:hypothetical protein